LKSEEAHGKKEGSGTSLPNLVVDPKRIESKESLEPLHMIPLSDDEEECKSESESENESESESDTEKERMRKSIDKVNEVHLLLTDKKIELFHTENLESSCDGHACPNCNVFKRRLDQMELQVKDFDSSVSFHSISFFVFLSDSLKFSLFSFFQF
jgi:hypothetical protein